MKILVGGYRLLQKILEWTVILIVVVLVLDVLWGVCSRFVLAEPSRWTEELAEFLLMWLALLGSALAFSQRKHLGVDYFVNKLDPEARRFNQIIVSALVAMFACVVLIYGGYILVSETLAAGQTTPALGLSMGWVYLAAPVTGIFIAFFCVEHIVELYCGISDEEIP